VEDPVEDQVEDQVEILGNALVGVPVRVLVGVLGGILVGVVVGVLVTVLVGILRDYWDKDFSEEGKKQKSKRRFCEFWEEKTGKGLSHWGEDSLLGALEVGAP